MIKMIYGFVIFIAFLFAASCKKDTPVVPPIVQQDTTSHLINWVIDDIGNYGSYLLDIAIIDENNIWAVGEIYMNDSLGNPDSKLYNLIKWNGTEWKPERIYFTNSQGQSFLAPMKSIFALSENDIWIGLDQLIHWDGSDYIEYELSDAIFQSWINKLWGKSSEDLYVVGNGGNIAHYSNGQWSKIESGTDVNLRDVWGSPDGSIVWAAGFEDSYGTVFLRNTGNGFEKVLEITGPNMPHPPNEITHVFKSLWTDKTDTVYLGAIGRVYAAPKNTTGYAKENIWWDYENQTEYPPETKIIRGTAGNDIFVGGYLQSVSHWNGASWKGYLELEGDGTWYSMAVKDNLIITVGESFSAPGNARIARGYRIK
ncbi:MAG: hypothetical protein AUK34_03895 [Ignavibacteria bacterium CG2_30_36_16]|nr:hypothetical protein [Ignavibacteria bacterium]OIP62074.1 MAG: hypothetical protein AUK34_03895 [Ignavibacteria bacterium CG2_30_36_16]PJB01424.1 MAG: hypothetical protein CO127_03865 [Ignavibacteria bacterium CG_4_9_14_3_um_filter_36_18]